MSATHSSWCLQRETEDLWQSDKPVAELGNDPRSSGCPGEHSKGGPNPARHLGRGGRHSSQQGGSHPLLG